MFEELDLKIAEKVAPEASRAYYITIQMSNCDVCNLSTLALHCNTKTN